MGWFSPHKKKQTPAVHKEDLWVRCKGCSAHVLKQEWVANLAVCPKCGYHARIGARRRLSLVVDEGSDRELDAAIVSADPLTFGEGETAYARKLSIAREKTGLCSAMVTVHATIHRIETVVSAMDFRFIGGSLGSAVGEKFCRAAGVALKKQVPYVVFCASGGARMQEGMFSLMQMAKTCAMVEKLHSKGIPYITVLTDPTAGGVSASYAMVGDVHLAEPGALIGFAGRRVIEQTIKQKLPEGFQTAEYLLEHGFVDAIVARTDMRDTLAAVLSYSVNAKKG
jgi:acetyl-CoA carboxylase carboxyl transferase subunit beta